MLLSITASDQNGWKNKRGTGSRKSGCGNWARYWEKFSNRNFFLQKCSVYGCAKQAEHGAHIFQSEVDKKEWIAPLCSECNNRNNSEEFSLKIGTILVSANKKETCGY